MSLVGSVIRNIKILEPLGEGGMGQVFVGFDEKLERRVAVKVIRPDRRLDERAKRRFLREARTLGQLEHLNICRIYDLIDEGGQMLIVLELVQGENLRDVMARGPNFREKLEIALQVARGMVAAHSMSVAHRDLKPENIMMTPEGVVKILDFGLARPLEIPCVEVEENRAPGSPVGAGIGEFAFAEGAAGSETAVDGTLTGFTQFGEVMGTPKYMSPEQARGEAVTAASDMYSLGLLFQELFCGKCPLGEGLDLSIICRKATWGESAPVEGLNTHLTALINRLKSFKPGERPSAPATAERLQWIADLPARRRRRIGVAAAWILLAVFAGGMTVQSFRARREAARAEVEALSAHQVSEFLVSLFQVSDPGEARGNSVTAREILDRGAEKIDLDLEDQPIARARLMHVMGVVYRELGLYDRGQSLLSRALAEREERLDSADPDIDESLVALAGLYRHRGSYDEAEEGYRRALERVRERRDRRAEAGILTSLGGLYHSTGKPEDGLLLLEESLAISESLPDADDAVLSDTLHNIGMILRDEGRCEEALPRLRRALEIDEAVHGENHHLVASSLESLASVLWCERRLDEARPLLLRAVDIYERSLGPDHPHLANCLNSLGGLYWTEGDPAASEAVMRRALGVYERALGTDHPYVGDVLGNIAVIVSDQGRAEEALTLHLRSVEVCEASVGPDHPKVATSLLNLAVELTEMGRSSEAGAPFDRAMEIRRQVFGCESPIVRETVERYAEALRVGGRQVEAETLLKALEN